MDSHPEPVAEPAPAEALPDTSEPASFESSLEAAFSQLDSVPDEPAPDEPAREEPLEALSDELPVEQPVAEEPEPEPEPQEPIES